MEESKAYRLLKGIQCEIITQSGAANTDAFSSLRSVDAKTNEAKMILSSVNGLPEKFVSDMETDINFTTNSRRVRLETLNDYIGSALKFLSVGGITKSQKKIYGPPDISKLTSVLPELDKAIDRRWREAQRCQHTKSYTAAIIMMGSILEALLLARATISAPEAYRSSRAPKSKDGKTPAVHDWTLNQLIEVAVDLNWIKSDRGKFGHALRESRNVVHPWVEVTTRANFDESTCLTSWEVLKASVNDLNGSA